LKAQPQRDVSRRFGAQLIETYSPKDGMVCDCCCGSGTTLLAAKKAGRRYFGIDTEPRFVEITQQRLAECKNVLHPVA
jgi:site-specific DNA-methyltransferase (adenine-specific)